MCVFWVETALIDTEGYRANVGIVIADGAGDVLWAKRVQAGDSWQFPQGGVNQGESPEDAAYRELYEEVGLESHQVNLISQTRGWLSYRIPEHLLRKRQKPRCIGQKQRWFLMQLDCAPEEIRFDRGEKAEFTDWRWVSYWYPTVDVVNFKQDVYRRALRELAPAHAALVAGKRYPETPRRLRRHKKNRRSQQLG